VKKRYSRKKSSDFELIAILALIVVAIFNFFKFLYDKLFSKGKIERIQAGDRPPNIPIPRSTVIKEDRPKEVDKYWPPTRKHAKPEIDKFLNVKRKTQIIIFDVETNGLNSGSSVLSCSAIKYEFDPSTFATKEMDRFHRYYYPREQFNPQATSVNGLTSNVLDEKRGSPIYPKYFTDDPDFEIFCKDVVRYVAHNISFDMQFIPFMGKKKKFCTMMTNMDIVAVYFMEWKREWKWPMPTSMATINVSSFTNFTFPVSACLITISLLAV
jgi:DNA polymerase III, epsilon subunit and related 3''-5'' exonucleases